MEEQYDTLALLGLARRHTEHLVEKHGDDTLGAVCDAVAMFVKDRDAMEVFGFTEAEVVVVQDVTGCGEHDARAKLIKHNGDIVKAAAELYTPRTNGCVATQVMEALGGNTGYDIIDPELVFWRAGTTYKRFTNYAVEHDEGARKKEERFKNEQTRAAQRIANKRI